MKRIIVLILLFCGAVIFPPNNSSGASSWQQIWGPVGTVMGYHDVIKGTSVIYATEHSTGDIYRYDGNPFKWTKVGGPGSMFAVDSKGSLYGLSPDKKGVFRYTGIPGKWTQIGGPAAGIYAGGEILLATSPGTLNLMAYLPQPIPQTPAAPTDLTASALSTTEVTLSWKDNANNEIGIKIERKGSGGYVQVGTVGTDVTNYNDSGLAPGTTYSYRIKAYNSAGDSPYSNEVTVATLPGQIIIPTIIKFYINNTTYYIDNVVKTMDTVPIIMESRTLLPVRYVAEPLGADVKWDTAEQKATVILKGKTIEMWINNPVAKVNGVDKYIDPDNQAVKPIIVPPGRTMLPLRFIAENLDCKVDWDEAKQEVTVTYPKP